MIPASLQAWNDFIGIMRARDRDSHAKTWFYLDAGHDAVFRALHIDKTDPAAFYACLPFRLMKIEGRYVILAAWPCTLELGPVDLDWLGVEQVVAWEPVSNTVEILGDVEPGLIGRFADTETGTLFGSPFLFFRRWVEERARFYIEWRQSAGKEWSNPPAERDLVPGCLISGNPDKVRWSSFNLPRNVDCIGIDPNRINKAILRDAKLPRAFSAMRAVA